jgi:methylated-DNA-protein-cysteine methyltransferase-like protein
MALGALRDADLGAVPWQRVINSAGRCSHRDGFWSGYQQEILEEEGVVFDRAGRVDLDRFRWTGPRREWRSGLHGEI